MRTFILLLCLSLGNFLQAQTETNKNLKSKPGFVIMVAADKNLPNVQQQTDVFKNKRAFFDQNNIRPFLITPNGIQAIYRDQNQESINFGDYKQWQKESGNFRVIVLDHEYTTKFRTETIIDPEDIAEVLQE